MIAKLLQNLPSSLGNFLVSWNLAPQQDRTLENLTKILLRADKRSRHSSTHEPQDNTMAFYAQRQHRLQPLNRFSRSNNSAFLGNPSGTHAPSSGSSVFNSGSYNGSSGNYAVGSGSNRIATDSYGQKNKQNSGSYVPPHLQLRPPSQTATQFHRCSGPTCQHFQHSTSASGISPLNKGFLNFEQRKQRAIQILKLKKITPCNNCGELRHWFNECPYRRSHFPLRPLARANLADTASNGDEDYMSSYDLLDSTSLPDPSSPDIGYSLDFTPHHTDFQDDTIDLHIDESQQDSPHYELSFMADSHSTRVAYSNSWIADTGATRHMTDRLDWFSTIETLPQDQNLSIRAIGGQIHYATGVGDIRIKIQIPNQQPQLAFLRDVLYVLGLRQNLFSTTRASQLYKFSFHGDDTGCKLTSCNQIIMVGKMVDCIYLLDFEVIPSGYTQQAFLALPFRDIVTKHSPVSLET